MLNLNKNNFIEHMLLSIFKFHEYFSLKRYVVLQINNNIIFINVIRKFIELMFIYIYDNKK